MTGISLQLADAAIFQNPDRERAVFQQRHAELVKTEDAVR
jgi:hypothetical protein